jgi:hypothetical protein
VKRETHIGDTILMHIVSPIELPPLVAIKPSPAARLELVLQTACTLVFQFPLDEPLVFVLKLYCSDPLNVQQPYGTPFAVGLEADENSARCNAAVALHSSKFMRVAGVQKETSALTQALFCHTEAITSSRGRSGRKVGVLGVEAEEFINEMENPVRG